MWRAISTAPGEYGGMTKTTAPHGYKTCACGAEFARSRTDHTVRCPECRKARGGTTRKAGTYTAVACGRCGHMHTTLKCDRCGF